jgi:DNA-binding NtrC family response regulator
MSRPNVLIVDDDPKYLSLLREGLSTQFDVATATTAEEAHRRLQFPIDAMLLDLRLNGGGADDLDGMRLLEAVKDLKARSVPTIIMTSFADVDVAVDVMRLGAADFVQKSRVSHDDLRKILKHVIARGQAERGKAEAEEERRRVEPWELVGNNRRLDNIRELIDAVARDGRITVLIRGETGTGKEVVARSIHKRGVRSERPMMTSAIGDRASTLIESELFGHEKGSFTGAEKRHDGLFRAAAGGVLFLDEIGEVPREVQAKLLRFLENRKVTPLGSTLEIPVDVQLVCATNRNLEEAVENGSFREDLYYRIRGMEIFLPPLRERMEDVPLLVDHFLFLLRQQRATRVAGITTAALDRLCRYRFPGNVRELQTIINNAAVMARLHSHTMIDMDDLPLHVTSTAPWIREPRAGEPIDLIGERARAELACIDRALQLTEGRKTEAWRLLGLKNRFALRQRLERINKLRPDFINDYPTLRACYADLIERLR